MHARTHRISRRLVDASPHRLIGLAELTHLRERTRRTRKHGRQASHQQRRANRHAAPWAVAQLQRYLAYKALLSGGRAVQVDAAHTSQACPRCGCTSEDNRPNKGLLFVCGVCHLRLHADLVGPWCMARRTLLARQDAGAHGRLVSTP
jgi:putative transposase